MRGIELLLQHFHVICQAFGHIVQLAAHITRHAIDGFRELMMAERSAFCPRSRVRFPIVAS
jgi:hypothetical protein